MKKNISRIIAIILVFSALFTSAGATGAGTAVYINTQQIANNLTYTNEVSYISNTQRQESYALALTGSGDAYPIVMACDTMYGSLTIDQMVSYAQGQGRNVLAAVNSDFFSMKTGVPMGLVVEDGVYKSSPEGLTAVAFKPDGSVCFSDSPVVTTTLTNSGSDTDTTNAGKTLATCHFNKYRTDTGGLYLFSSAFSTVSTRTTSNGWFVKFKIITGTPSISGTMTLVVEETLTTDGAIPIGEGYLVLSAATAAGFEEEFGKFKVGDNVTLTTTCSDINLTNTSWATGAGDVLVKDGTLTDQTGWDTAISVTNPRTAFGVKADGTVISYVIDGRSADNSVGLTLKCLAEEMLAQGCVWAVNFDGGGSSALSVRLPGQATSTVVNDPSDGTPRKCGAYILFVTNAVSDLTVKHLAMQNDGPVVLAGSSVSLSYFASDSGYKPVTAPADIIALATSLGSVNGTTYTAGLVHGVDKLTLMSSSTGATGYATMHIIYNPTAAVVTDDTGVALSSLTPWSGDSVQLKATASYNGLPVIADLAAFKYSITGDIGTISEAGLYTAGGLAGTTGSVNISVGGLTVMVPVTLTGFADVTNHWSKSYVKDLTGNGIVAGISPSVFAPEAGIKRGDFVLMLWRAAGQPEPTGLSSFTDVLTDDYYAKAIAWAEENTIAKGLGDGLFNPQSTLTREQAFTFVYRALAPLNISYTDGTADALNAFSDSGLLSPYAVTPTATLVNMGVVSGANALLTPGNEISRSQMAKILSTVMDLA